MGAGHERNRRSHLQGCNRGTAYPDNLYAYPCHIFPLPCFTDDISCTETRRGFQFFRACPISLESYCFLTAACNWSFSVDMVGPAFYKSEGDPRTCQPTPEACQYRPLRLREKPDVDRRISHPLRGWVYYRVPIPSICFCPDLCILQCS